MILRAVDIKAGKGGAASINLRVCTAVALYILIHKRDYLQRLAQQRGLNVVVLIHDSLAQGGHALERTDTNEDFVPEDGAVALANLPTTSMTTPTTTRKTRTRSSRTTLSPPKTPMTTLPAPGPNATMPKRPGATGDAVAVVVDAVVAADIATRDPDRPTALRLIRPQPRVVRTTTARAHVAVAGVAVVDAGSGRKVIVTASPGSGAAPRRLRIPLSGSIRSTPVAETAGMPLRSRLTNHPETDRRRLTSVRKPGRTGITRAVVRAGVVVAAVAVTGRRRVTMVRSIWSRSKPGPPTKACRRKGRPTRRWQPSSRMMRRSP